MATIDTSGHQTIISYNDHTEEFQSNQHQVWSDGRFIYVERTRIQCGQPTVQTVIRKYDIRNEELIDRRDY